MKSCRCSKDVFDNSMITNDWFSKDASVSLPRNPITSNALGNRLQEKVILFAGSSSSSNYHDVLAESKSIVFIPKADA